MAEETTIYDIHPEVPTGVEESKLNRLSQGPLKSFPGNASLMQFFNLGIMEHRINGERTALIENEINHSYNNLNEISNSIANALKTQLESLSTTNPDGDTVIGICIPPSDKLIFTLFAIMKLGAAYVPFDLAMPEDRVVKIVKDCKPILIVSDSHGNTMGKFDVVSDLVKVLGYTDLLNIVDKEQIDPTIPVEPLPGMTLLAERTAIVLYTSGSSGEPKGVRLSHRAVMNRLSWQWKTFPFVSGERCVFKTSLTFVDSVSEIFGPLLQGFPVVVLSKIVVSNPSVFIQRLDTFVVTRVVLVPSLLKAILQTLRLIDPEERKDLLTNVHLWVVSGEALKKDLVDEFFDNFPKNAVLSNFYGSTEIMGDVTYVTFTSKKSVYDHTVENQIPIGNCIHNTLLYILDNKMELVPLEQQGEIYIAGYNLAKGYVGISDSDKFIDNPFTPTEGFNRLYRTGDFGRLAKTRNGTLMILYEGRTDAQIKVRGQRVDLTEVEYALSQLHIVKKAVVLCFHPGLADQSIVAFISGDPDVTSERITELLRTKLREYEMPLIRLIPEIPLLINGKTDRQRLLRTFQFEKEKKGEFDDWNSLGIPREDAKAGQTLIQIISDVTGRSVHDIVVDLDDSFYNLGGTSLNSIEVILKLRDEGYNISISDFVTSKTILEIIDKMILTKTIESSADLEDNAYYVIEKLSNSLQDDTISMISHSFAHKGDLEAYTNASYQEFTVLVKSLWKDLVQTGFSFVVRRKDDQSVVGVALNFDIYDEPATIDASHGILYVLEMLEFIESRQREKLPRGKGKIIHSFMMGTKAELDDSENVNVVEFMEENIIQLGKNLNFLGIITTNTNPLTRAICCDVLGYEVLSEYQVNQYLAPDGTRPFLLAPDDFKVVCCWKKLDNLTVLDDF